MDKHERRRLRANDQRLGKMHDEVAAFYRKDKHVRDKRFLYEMMLAYTPCAGRLLTFLRTAESYGPMRVVNVDGKPVQLWLEDYAPWGRRRAWHDEPDIVTYLEERIEDGGRIMRWGGPIGDGLAYCAGLKMDYVYDPFHQRIDVNASLKKFQRLRDAEFIREIGPSFFRTTERTALFRKELEEVSGRWRAIHNCKHIKEELMAAMWHPRRVEKLLDTYGWDAYNNLLGE